MELKKEIIAFRRGRLVVSSKEIVDPRNLENNRNLILISLVNELEKFGYYISSECLCKLSVEDMEGIHKNLIPYLNYITFADKDFKPLYPGFPEQVINKTDAELWIDRDRVYFGDLDGFLKDNPWKSEKAEEDIKKDPQKELKAMTVEEFMDIPQQIMGSGNSLSEETREELLWFLDTYKDLPVPERIPFKETLCLVVSKRAGVELKEVNDVLRYGIYLLGGSPDLPNVPKEIWQNSWRSSKIKNPEWRNLKSLPRSRRREICQRLETIIEKKGLENCIPDAKSNYGHWVLLSERLHPGEFILRFPETAQFFHSLKSHNISKQYPTFNSKVVEMYRNEASTGEITKFISKMPGELVRRFDSLIRRSKKEGTFDEVLDIFFDTQGMKNKTLLELLSYYDRRDNDVPRFISLPGSSSKYRLPDLEKHPEYLVETVREVIIRKVLLNIRSRIVEKDMAGKTIYLDPRIKDIPIPKAMRNQSISIPTGTKFDIPKDQKYLRFFVHWIQESKDKNEDLDLHAFLWRSDTKCRQIGWNSSLKDEDLVAVHSGDVLDRVGDCAEYIDIDMDKARESGVKYIVADIMNFKGRGLDTLPCWIGYTTGTRLRGGDKKWIPKDVNLSVEMNCRESNVAAFLVDVQESKIMVLDCAMKGVPVPHGFTEQTSIIKFFTVEQKYTSYDILKEYYEAKGAKLVDRLPDDEEELKEVEKIEFSDISSDYVKVLNIIGE